MKYVIDCSSAFPMYVAEPLTGKAVALRDGYLQTIHELLAPDFLTTEMSNALIVAERRGRIAKGDATRLFQQFLKQLPALHPAWPDLLPRAHAIAEATVASVYDCLYIALAERENCEMVTADDKLVRNLQAQFPFIVSLASLP
jgi:predicted nucleic acid-binding protein